MTWMTFVHILLIVVLHQTIVQVYCFGLLLLMSQLLLLYVLVYQHLCSAFACFLFILKKLIKNRFLKLFVTYISLYPLFFFSVDNAVSANRIAG